MGFKLEVKGLTEIQSQLKRLQSRARSLHGTHSVPIRDLLTDQFMQKHTRFASVDEWFAQSPFEIQSQKDFESIPDAEWDSYVRTSTAFASWQDMLQKAGVAFAEKKLLS